MSYLSEFIDRNTKDLQKITKAAQDAAMMTAYGLAGSNQFQSSSGKNYGINKEAITEHLQPNLDQDLADTPVVKAIEEVVKPAEQVAQTVVNAAEPVVQAAVESVKVPFEAVEEVTKIDVPKVVESVIQEVVQAPAKVTETVVNAAEPVVQAAVEVAQQPVKLVEEISKIDVPKVVENVVTQAATTVTETPKMGVKVAEEAVLKPLSAATVYATNELKQAGELVFNNLIDPFQPGETEGTVAEEPVAADLDAKDFGGNEDPFSTIETSTTKADKLTEEERLRRIRRLMLNRYGREDTILTGAKDPFNRRRYARSL
jgi:hypothetical protein